MNVSELFQLTQWISKEIVNPQVLQKYQGLHQALNKSAQPNQHKQPFEDQKNDLINTINYIQLNKLTKDQLSFLSELKIAETVGPDGVENLEDILFRNTIDIATAAQKVSQIVQNLSYGIKKSDQIKAGLDGCVEEEIYETDNEILMRVSFTGNAAMSNIVDFKEWGNIWYDIGRGIAMANNESPEGVKIIGATKGSIIIELAVLASIATTTSAIIIAALKVAEKVLEIRKKAEEIKNLKLQNKQLAVAIEKEAENEKEAGINQILNKILKELSIKKKGDGEKVNALDRAVKNLVDFIESGGEVDFILPEEIEDDEEANDVPNYDDLRVAFEEIRQLENKVKLLESRTR